MDKLQKYILKKFFNIFINIFFVLFLIISIIIIISISNVTSSIHITFAELIEMYLLSLTKVLIVALSISFFISAIQNFANFSETQELIAIFSTGIEPKHILNPIFLMALILTFVNLFILFISIPYSDLAYHNFKMKKKQEAKFNIETLQISQRFGDWNVFIEKKSGKQYKKIYLYNPKENKFIVSSEAEIINNNSFLTFQLKEGHIYQMDKNLTISFNKMNINQNFPFVHFSILEYKKFLQKNKKLFLFYLPFALIPISLFFYIPLFGFFHPRLHKNHSLIYAIITLTLYLVIARISHSFIIVLAIVLMFFLFGIIYYKKDKKF